MNDVAAPVLAGESTRIIELPRMRGWIIAFAIVLLVDFGIFIRVFGGQIPFNYTYDITDEQKLALEQIMAQVQQAWPDQRVVFDAAIRIQEDIGQQAIPTIIEYSRHEDSDLRCFSMQMLGAFEDKIATEAVIAGLQDEEPLVAFYATMALGTIGDPVARDHLATALDHPDYRVRASAALNLSIVGMHNRHVEAMIAHLGDPSPRVNESIQESLTVGLDLSDMLLGRQPEVWAKWWEETGRAQANLPD